MDQEVSVDIEKYCSELSFIKTQCRPVEQRYFVRRYKVGVYDLLSVVITMKHFELFRVSTASTALLHKYIPGFFVRDEN